MRLRTQLFLTMLLPPLIGFLLLGGGLFGIVHWQQEKQQTQLQQQLLKHWAAQLTNSSSQGSLEKQLQQLVEGTQVARLSVTHLDGEVVAQAASQPLLEQGDYQQKSLLLPVTQANQPLQLVAAFSQRPNQLLFYRLLLLFVIGFTLLLVACSYLTLGFTFNITDPIDQLIEQTRKIAALDFTLLPPSHATGELKRLENTLAQMACAINDELDDIKESGETAINDMRCTLEVLEEKNIQLDITRRDLITDHKHKNEFFNNMNHEIRTSLNSILGFSRLLSRSLMEPEQQEQLRSLRKSANTLLDIVNNILDYSRLEENRIRMVASSFNLRDLIEEIQDTLSPQAHDKRLELITLIDARLPDYLVGDTLRIRQALTNLISNAIKYSHEGDIVVRADLELQQQDKINLRLSVSDQGPGISDELKASIFEPYSHGPEGGSGLGLAICKRMTEEMEGKLQLESLVGSGTTFTLLLPLHSDSAKSSHSYQIPFQSHLYLLENHELLHLALHQQLSRLGIEADSLATAPDDQQDHNLGNNDVLLIDPDHCNIDRLETRLDSFTQQPHCLLVSYRPLSAHSRLTERLSSYQLLPKPLSLDTLRNALLTLSDQAPRLPTLDVMVVDDHEGNRRIASLFLEDMGMNVSCYEDGKSALVAFEQQRPQLVLMDIFMPGMDGKQCAQKMRRLEPQGEHTPIYALTAELQKMEGYRLLEAGMDGHLCKPLHEKTLRELLQRLAEQQANEPLFDETLALKRCGGRPEAALEMQRMLHASLADTEEQLRRLCQAQDWPALLEVTHKLHGGTRYCGVPLLEQSAASLETALKQQQTSDELLQLTQQLLNSIEKTQSADEINAFISRTA